MENKVQSIAEYLNLILGAAEGGDQAALYRISQYAVKALNMVKERRSAVQHPRIGWVKAIERLPGWNIPVKWRLGSGPETQRKIALSEMTDNGAIIKWEWYDESASPAAGREEDAVALIKYIRENYKPSKEVWKDKFGIALLSDEGILSMYNQQKGKALAAWEGEKEVTNG